MMREPTPWSEYLERYREDERQRDADMRSGASIPGYRYTGPPMVPTPERHIRESWRNHVDAFEQAMATRWAARFESWLHPRTRPTWDLVTSLINNDFRPGDAETLAKWFAWKVES